MTFNVGSLNLGQHVFLELYGLRIPPELKSVSKQMHQLPFSTTKQVLGH